MESAVLGFLAGFVCGFWVSHLVERKRAQQVLSDLGHLRRRSEELQSGYRAMEQEVLSLMARHATFMAEMKAKHDAMEQRVHSLLDESGVRKTGEGIVW